MKSQIMSEVMVPPNTPAVNQPVKLRLHNKWLSVLTVSDNMIRNPVLYKLKKVSFLKDGEKRFLLGSFFDECVHVRCKFPIMWFSLFFSFISTQLLEL